MDLDLAQVRAFTAVAGALHFGAASEELAISQQALSKRIARLEERLGARLFDRGGGQGVRLTAAGARFLGPARRALAAGDAAVAAVLGDRQRLRMDVWGHLYAPLRTLARVLAEAPHLDVEPGTGRDFPSVAEALRRGEVSAGLGRVPTAHRPGAPYEPRDRAATAPAAAGPAAPATPAPALAEPAHRVVRLEPVDAVLSADHPLADAPHLRPADLRGSVLRYPADAGRLDFLTRFADHFGVERHTAGPNLGLLPFLSGIRADPTAFSLFPADAVAAGHPGVRFVPLVAPTPLYAWSLVWPGPRALAPYGPGRGPETAPEPAPLRELLDAFARTARRNRWLEFDPTRDWLPDPGEAASTQF
ncbi:LysR family transcriptional regulator [Streptomyces sp. URMC 123]|uniref:LysR family transcriptional regulator n=1 Tax=Streptomyces sp. URMC 123 TaxID=3423403 RepID=UPI003F1C2EF3